jgi:hypothetical protein
LLATGFLRNHKITEEGGVIDENTACSTISTKRKQLQKGCSPSLQNVRNATIINMILYRRKKFYQFLAFFHSSKEKGVDGGFSDGTFSKNPIMEITDKEVKTIFSFINKPDTGHSQVICDGEIWIRFEKRLSLTVVLMTNLPMK